MDHVYGYYPTDINGDGRYSKADLENSPGDLHIHTIGDFHNIYKGNVIFVIELESSLEKENKLNSYFGDLYLNPGIYSLYSSQCTTRAIKGLLQAGYPADPSAVAPWSLYYYYTKIYYNQSINNAFYNLSGIVSIKEIKAEDLQ